MKAECQACNSVIDKIIVKQHFNNLPSEKIAVVWPISSENRSCDLSKNSDCDRLTEDLTAFKEGESSSQSISYEIPLLDGLKEAQIFSAKVLCEEQQISLLFFV